MADAIRCPECGSSYWSRLEERTVQDEAWIQTDETDVFEFHDEETVETKALGPWECGGKHDATDDISEQLQEMR